MTDSLEIAGLPKYWKNQLPFPTPVSTGSGSEGLLSGRAATPRAYCRLSDSHFPRGKSRGHSWVTPYGDFIYLDGGMSRIVGRWPDRCAGEKETCR